MAKKIIILLLFSLLLCSHALAKEEVYYYTPNAAMGQMKAVISSTTIGGGTIDIYDSRGNLAYHRDVINSYGYSTQKINMRPGNSDLMVYVIEGSGSFLNQLLIIGPNESGVLDTLFDVNKTTYQDNGSCSVYAGDNAIFIENRGSKKYNHAKQKAWAVYQQGKYTLTKTQPPSYSQGTSSAQSTSQPVAQPAWKAKLDQELEKRGVQPGKFRMVKKESKILESEGYRIPDYMRDRIDPQQPDHMRYIFNENGFIIDIDMRHVGKSVWMTVSRNGRTVYDQEVSPWRYYSSHINQIYSEKDKKFFYFVEFGQPATDESKTLGLMGYDDSSKEWKLFVDPKNYYYPLKFGPMFVDIDPGEDKGLYMCLIEDMGIRVPQQNYFLYWNSEQGKFDYVDLGVSYNGL